MSNPVYFAILMTLLAVPMTVVALRSSRSHPKGLPVLFFSEMWERFCFYGMRAILTLYMTDALGFNDGKAIGVYGVYGALVYAFPVLGGKLADSILGYRRAILLGGFLMFLGEVALLIEGEWNLYLGLALLCIGNGFFKPNISSTVGRLYDAGDTRRDSGFTIFYMGINLGALLAPLWCGYLGETIQPYALGFGLAGLGMAFGLIWFHTGRSKLEGKGESSNPEALKKFGLLIVLASLVASIPMSFAFAYAEIMEYVMYAVMVFVFGYLFLVAGKEESTVSRDRLYALMILMLFHACFWGFFEQAGSSLTLFAKRCVDRDIGFTEVTAGQLQAVNPFFILLFAPLFSGLWALLARKKKQLSIPNKFAVGLVQLGLGFLVLNLGSSIADDGQRTALFFLVFMYLLHTTGELCISPVGLSAVTKLAPERITSFVMGAWFLTVSLGHIIAAGIAKLAAVNFPQKEAIGQLTKNLYRGNSVENMQYGENMTRSAGFAEFFENLGKDADPNAVFAKMREMAGQASSTGDGNWPSVEMVDRLQELAGGSGVTQEVAVQNFDKFAVPQMVEVYQSVYPVVGITAIGFGVLVFLLGPLVRKLLHGVE